MRTIEIKAALFLCQTIEFLVSTNKKGSWVICMRFWLIFINIKGHCDVRNLYDKLNLKVKGKSLDFKLKIVVLHFKL